MISENINGKNIIVNPLNKINVEWDEHNLNKIPISDDSTWNEFYMKRRKKMTTTQKYDPRQWPKKYELHENDMNIDFPKDERYSWEHSIPIFYILCSRGFQPQKFGWNPRNAEMPRFLAIIMWWEICQR